MSARWDVIVIGAGANGLAAAHALSRRGRKVLVLERRASAGNAFDDGWVAPDVIRETGVSGLAVTAPDPWLTVPLEGGGKLELWRDVQRSAEAIRKLSPADSDRWPEFCARMGALARFLERVYSQPAPDIEATALGELSRLGTLGVHAKRLGRQGMLDLLRVPPMAIAELLDDWFECDALKGAIGAAGILHMHQGPRSGGTGFVFLHNSIGSPAGVFRPPQSNLSELLARQGGVEVRCGIAVERVLVSGGRATGVVLAGGEEIAANVMASSADPRATLLGMVDADWLEPEFRREVANIKCRGVVAHIRLELERPADFTRLSIAPSLTFLEKAYDHVKYGRVSSECFIEVSATGREAVAHVQYVPRVLSAGEWDEASRTALGAQVVAALVARVPGVGGARVLKVKTPADFETTYGLTGGHLHHGEHTLDQVLFARPVAGWSRYRTPLPGLFLCGAGAHPGSAVAGGAGVLAARAILEG